MLKVGLARSPRRAGSVRASKLTMGQALYVIISSNPDGASTEALVARMQETRPSMEAKHIEACAEDLQTDGYIRHDNGRWYAPGPKPIIWEAL